MSDVTAWLNQDGTIGGSTDPSDVPEGTTALTQQQLLEEIAARTNELRTREN